MQWREVLFAQKQPTGRRFGTVEVQGSTPATAGATASPRDSCTQHLAEAGAAGMGQHPPLEGQRRKQPNPQHLPDLALP